MVMVTLRRDRWTCSMNDKEEGANIRGPGRMSLAKNTGKVQAEMSLWWFGVRKMAGSLGPGQEGPQRMQDQIVKSL